MSFWVWDREFCGGAVVGEGMTLEEVLEHYPNTDPVLPGRYLVVEARDWPDAQAAAQLWDRWAEPDFDPDGIDDSIWTASITGPDGTVLHYLKAGTIN
jgi:hypothetical protein